MNKIHKISIYILMVVLFSCAVRGAQAAEGDENESVLIPAGKFNYGDEDEGPLVTIDLKAFNIDKYEVTNAQYKKFKSGHEFLPDKANHPVTNVSWHEANTYCKSVGKRLPMEEEWEKAARGTDGRAYPWGEDFESGKVNSSEANTGGKTPVGKYEAGKSPYGIYDMAGNVREWVDSWFSDEKIYRVVRGGGYIDDEDTIYTFTRKRSIPEDIKDYVGFRCAR